MSDNTYIYICTILLTINGYITIDSLKKREWFWGILGIISTIIGIISIFFVIYEREVIEYMENCLLDHTEYLHE